MNPEMTLLSVHSEAIGYGRLGVKLTDSLERAGVDVYDHLEPPPGYGTLNAEERKVAEGRRHKRTNVVGWVSVPTHARGWYRGQYTWIFTMWEATELPESFRQTFHEFDLIVVPSRQNQELFSRYHPNVAYAPLGVDPTEWHYVERTPPGAFFDVLVGGSGGRKGLDLAVEAFAKAFPEGWWGDGPIPRLILKSPKETYGLSPEVRRDLPWPDPARLLGIHGRLDPTDEQGLYAQAHVYLQPSRGEGFGLQPLQAIAQGCPTILTDAHGHEAFSHLGWPVSATLEEAGYFIFGGEELGMQWWLPDVDEIVDHLRSIYADWDGAAAVAARAAAEARAFTWDATAVSVMDAVGRDRLCVEHRLVEGDPWVVPEQKLYRVVLNRDWNADIGGVSRRFEAGVEYWETADVKRIMFEAGWLDPSCYARAGLTEGGEWIDDGLLPSQHSRVNQAQDAYCPTCSQRLNSQPTLGDDLLALLDEKRPLDRVS